MKQLVKAVLDLDEDMVIKLINKKLDLGEDPLQIISQVQEGVIQVGHRYDQGKYFIADLIMAGLIFSEVLKYIHFKPEAHNENYPNVIFATVERDIHDIGKNIAVSFFQSKGVAPLDLGVDVSPKKIIHQIDPNGYTALYLSGLLTSSYDSMKETIRLIHESPTLNDRVKVIICGLVDEEVKNFVGADYWITDVVDGYNIFLTITNQFQNVTKEHHTSADEKGQLE